MAGNGIASLLNAVSLNALIRYAFNFGMFSSFAGYGKDVGRCGSFGGGVFGLLGEVERSRCGAVGVLLMECGVSIEDIEAGIGSGNDGEKMLTSMHPSLLR